MILEVSGRTSYRGARFPPVQLKVLRFGEPSEDALHEFAAIEWCDVSDNISTARESTTFGLWTLEGASVIEDVPVSDAARICRS